MFDVIERLKSEWTDRFVVISRPAPELARFAQATGVVRTVNMNGRCLVEFDQHNNIGWYDIDPAFLRIVPAPQPKPAQQKIAQPKAAPGEKPAAKAPVRPPAKTAPAEGAAAAPAAPGAPAKPAAGRPSTADILALARGRKASADSAAAARAPVPEEAEPLPSQPPATEPAPVAEPVAAVPAAKGGSTAEKAAGSTAEKAAGSSVKLATTAEKIAWCRSHDGKG